MHCVSTIIEFQQLLDLLIPLLVVSLVIFSVNFLIVDY
jgi:hypothetical protein